jgi:steroid delta-isomerase-like uncharacterized protein
MTPRETVICYWRAWTEHDLGSLLALLAPDFVSRSSLSQGRAADKGAISEGFKMFDKALPDLKEEVVSITAEDDLVACQVVETATFMAPMELPTGTVAPTYRSYKLPVASFFRINAQGLIAEQRTYWDTANWAQQIGIDPNVFVPNLEASKLVDPPKGSAPIAQANSKLGCASGLVLSQRHALKFSERGEHQPSLPRPPFRS